MSLRVVSFAAYLTTAAAPWRNADYCASAFVKAIKAWPFAGYHWIPVCGNPRRLTQENSDDAIQWFGEMTAAHFMGKFRSEISLVPIPNSNCTIKNKTITRTKQLAESIAGRLNGITIWDGLRWKKPMTPSSKGGTRDPHELYENLVVTKGLPVNRIIIVDDVRTTGAHLIAAKARLIEKDGNCNLAICAGRTALVPEHNPFATIDEELDDLTIEAE
jgi:hypothetical protein